MKAFCLVALAAVFGSAIPSHAESKAAAPPTVAAAPAAEAQALGMAMADAVEKSADCHAMGPNLDAAIAAQSHAIEVLSASKAADSGSLSADQQKRLLAMAQKAKGCAGQVQTAAVEKLRTALAAYDRRAKPVKLASTSWCENNCCIKGWETWAAVTFFTAACLAGDNQACCLATTIASYDACVNTYCPTNNCCQDVPPGGPVPKKAPGF
jgi:hypothetical protein